MSDTPGRVIVIDAFGGYWISLGGLLKLTIPSVGIEISLGGC